MNRCLGFEVIGTNVLRAFAFYFLNEAIRLKSQDVLVKQVKNGKKAVEFLKDDCKDHMSRKPDLIFMDINMKKMNGIEASEIIKRSKDLCTIPLIILTTSFDKEQKDACKEIGVDGFYIKPNSIEKYGEIFEEVSKKYLATSDSID